MKEIIQYFKKETKSSKYVFPIILPNKESERKQYEAGLNLQNLYLGFLSQLAGINRKITTHVSRHTWATLAKRTNVSISIISEALGHKNTDVTNRYLASFEPSVMNKISDRMSNIICKNQRVA